MHTTELTAPAVTRRSAIWNFTRHYLEMVAAMIVGMVALAPVWNWLFDALGVAALFDRPDLGSLVMATNMTIAMSAWMKFRGHGWAPITEMAAAMYLPFIALFFPLWAGLIDGHTLMTLGHVLMLPAMALAMLLRRAEYTRPHGHHH
ncbi:hypothetical protein D477_020778 [Arthrobacter crystallopoietes BAB-32]|uniref:Flagellar biosynthetic protein FliP n=1 Tax=Arthrobacter crystallopoietes BAB-32 TaxID=1246476 RepID=N1UPJ1_9MICC|nr:hypothetical protein [Arthrobacter crystallopoietes]EMY32321.1 hypothetical protein D477_020778 [Arthrobacter crystallopoietes BAB-32]